MRPNLVILLGAVSGFISVAAGAFAAHGLKARLAADLLAIFETAARYQIYHALLLVLVGLLAGRADGAAYRPPLMWSAHLLLAGTVLFSGSLYVLALTEKRWLGAVTPFGGLCFLLGWLALAYGAFLARDGLS